MKKISVIFGTRPEAIKLFPVIVEFKKSSAIECKVCVTGQHRQMLDQVLETFNIVPDMDLDLMQPNQSLTGFTARAIETIGNYLSADKPDVVVVQGDTTTVLSAALAAFYHKIPVAHVEAGLRTGNMMAPWPEEANRVLTSRLARWHFAPTEKNRLNLLAEGVLDRDIYVTGNTVVDALFLARDKIRNDPPFIPNILDRNLADTGDRRMVLITGHRRENFGEGFENICLAILDLARRFPDVDFVYPVHLNPNVREPVQRVLDRKKAPNIYLIEPQPYLPFVALMNRAKVILTDSGGVQEEAPSLGKPVLVMRDTTERPEAVSAGVVKLVGSKRESIVAEVTSLLETARKESVRDGIVNPYGDGRASGRIVDILAGSL